MTETTTPTPKSDQQRSTTTNIVEMAAYPVSAVAGAYAFNTTVGNKLYDDLHGLGWLGKELEEHKKFYRYKEHTTLGKIAEWLPGYHKKFSKILSQELKNQGFHNIIDRFNGIHPSQKVEAFVAGATAFGISLGVLLTVANNQALFAKINKKEQKNAVNEAISH